MELKQRAKDSLFFTATALLGFDRLTTHLHYEMCHVAERAEQYKRLLCLVPRDHYKTTIFTIAYPVWRALRNPNETGLIVANTATNAARFVDKIKKCWTELPLLRSLFWDLRPELSRRWNRLEATLPRTIDYPEPTWSAAGWDTKVTSQHFDYIIFDDIVDEETYESPDLMAKLVSRFEQREGGLLRPPVQDRVVIVVMNRWSAIDIADHITRNHPEYQVYYRQAIEEGKPIFPEAYTMEWLLRKQKADPYFFALQYMNNPADREIVEMRASMFQEYKRTDTGLILPDDTEVPLGHLYIVAAGDPRHSIATKAADKMTARNALTVVGKDSKGRQYLLEEWASRGSQKQFLDKMLELHRKWHPVRFGIESFGYQQALQPLSAEIWKNEVDKPRLELLPRDTKDSKDTRIRGGLQFFRTGLAYVHRTQAMFLDEAVTFPASRTKDLLDCWTWCTYLTKSPGDEATDEQERERDAAHFARLHPMVGI